MILDGNSDITAKTKMLNISRNWNYSVWDSSLENVMLSSVIYPHVIPNPYNLNFSVEQWKKYSEKKMFLSIQWKLMGSNIVLDALTFIIWTKTFLFPEKTSYTGLKGE